MKRTFFYCLLAVALTACSKQNGTSAVPANEPLPIAGRVDTTVQKIAAGMFVNGPHGSVTGNTSIFLQNGKYVLALEQVAISNGPDLHVYLSKEKQPVNFIDIGKLKSTSGNQVYDITGMPSLNEYTFVLIHCQQYNHLFGSASLK